MIRIYVLPLAALAMTGCATPARHAGAPPPQREIFVHTGVKDPAYAIPDALKARVHAERLANVRFQQEAAQLHERVRGDPAFGGLIIRSSPEPHADVMFTGNAQAHLAKYTGDPRFKARSVALTLAELERLKDRMSAQLAGLGLRCFAVDGDEEYNSVTVGAPLEELAKVRSAIAAGTIQAPRKLRLVEQACAQFR